MLQSMTGFGSASGAVDAVQYDVEVRSVNHRYLKTFVRLPAVAPALETRIEQRVRKRLSRGTVTVSVRVKLPPEEATAAVHREGLEAYVAQIEALRGARKDTYVDLGSLLQLPGVCEAVSLEEVFQRTSEGLLTLLDEALAALRAMRQREGQALHDDLRQHCTAIEEHLAEVAGRKETVLAEYHQRLTDRVRELTLSGTVQIDEETLAREVALFAERSDIAEEVSRLRGHLEQFREALEAPEAAGRKLDFIAQEMLREANTIASKASDAEIARRVVDIKTGIDRIKEQVQNVE